MAWWLPMRCEYTSMRIASTGDALLGQYVLSGSLASSALCARIEFCLFWPRIHAYRAFARHCKRLASAAGSVMHMYRTDRLVQSSHLANQTHSDKVTSPSKEDYHDASVVFTGPRVASSTKPLEGQIGITRGCILLHTRGRTNHSPHTQSLRHVARSRLAWPAGWLCVFK